MRNIEIFTVASGVASLILEEIPYKKIAYIKIQTTHAPEELLRECVNFCRAAGAESIIATGHSYLDQYPYHTSVYKMSASQKEFISDANAVLINEADLSEWIKLYNRRMADVPNAATMTYALATELLGKKQAYFVYDESECIGLGVVAENKLHSVVSLIPGRGKAVLFALATKIRGEKVLVEVSSANKRAMRLYEAVGFRTDETLSEWYDVSGCQ